MYHISIKKGLIRLEPRAMLECSRAWYENQDAPCICGAPTIWQAIIAMPVKTVESQVLYVYQMDDSVFKDIHLPREGWLDEHRAYVSSVECTLVGTIPVWVKHFLDVGIWDIWYRYLDSDPEIVPSGPRLFLQEAAEALIATTITGGVYENFV